MTDEQSAQPKRIPQFAGAFVVTLGGFCLGAALGWSSPASKLLKPILSDSEISWASSILNLGCAVAAIATGFIFDIIGRKYSIIIMSVVLIAGWIMVIIAKSFALYAAGRFVTGLACGSYCVTCPTFVAELAHKNVRGQLGILFQLQLVTAILLAYSLGEANSFHVLNIPFVILAGILIVCMLFLPESPTHLYAKGKDDQSKKSLQFFRGKQYNIDLEMTEIEQYVKKPEMNLWEVAKQRATVKAFLMLLVLHMVQQLSGINAVIFFADPLFKSVTPSVPSGIASIILGIVNFVFTVVSIFIVDRFGRRILWYISLSLMIVSLVLIGLHYQIKSQSSGYMAVAFIYIYLMGFAVGSGPLPWLMLGELMPNSMKFLCSVVACTNWLMSFAVTRSFEVLVKAVGAAAVFWGYAVFCVLGFLFVFFVVIETKGKTLDEIQKELSKGKES